MSIAFARPDSNGTFQYEFFEGWNFTIYSGNPAKVGLQPVTTDASNPGGNGPSGRMWRSGQTQVCNSIANDDSMTAWAPILNRIGIRSSVAIPLLQSNGEILAGITAYSSWPRYFGIPRRQRAFEHMIHVLTTALARFDSGVVLGHSRRSELKSRLRTGALEIYYQPIVSLADSSLHKVEALARMRDHDNRLMAPAEFLPAFGSEELLYVFQRCLEIGIPALERWDKINIRCGLSINISPHAFSDRRYLHVLSRELKNTRLPANRFTLELTEDEDLINLDVDAQVVKEFRDLGILLAQDDLGAGYSSLVRLEKFGFHEVKIDQALIRSASEPINSLDLIQHLTSLSHDLGISVVVEGLESESLIEAASILGADYGQGYGIGMPMPESEFLAWFLNYSEPLYSHNPRTTFGALAMLRKWSRKLVALGGYIERIDPKDLVEDLRAHLVHFSEVDFDGRLEEHTEGTNESPAVTLIRFAEALFGDLMELSSPVAEHQSLGTRRSLTTARVTLRIDEPDQNQADLTFVQLQALFDLQNWIIKKLEGETPAGELLDAICHQAEKLLPNSVATVMVRNEVGDLFLKASPSLPDHVADRFAKITPSPTMGSCANVILSDEPVFVENAFLDPRWRDLVQVARDLEICACWSFPVRDKNGVVFGTFALSSFEIRSPDSFHRQLLEVCASLVGVVLGSIERHETVRSRGLRLERMFQDSGSKKLMYRVSDGEIVEANLDAAEFLGYSVDELKSMVISQISENLVPRVLLSFVKKANENRAWHTFSYYRLANSQLRPVEVDSRVFVDNDELYVCSTISDAPYFSKELESERQITAGILDSISAMVIILDRNGVIARFNRQAEIVTGFTASEVIGVRDIWEKWIDPNDLERVRAEFVLALTEQKSGTIDVWHMHKDGERRLMEVRYMPLETSSSFSRERLALLCTDITERYNDAVKIQSQLDFISQVVEVLANLVFVVDANGYVIQCNKAFTDFVGESFEQISAKPFYVMKFVIPEAHDEIRRWFAAAIDGEMDSHTMVAWIDKTGQRRVFEWSNVAVYDREGNLTQVVIMGTDVTERRYKEKQLEKAAVVFENSSEAIVFIDNEGLVTEVNPAFTLMTGFQRDEVIGKRARHFASFEQGDEFYDEMKRELIESGHWSGSSRNYRADKTAFFSYLTVTVLHGRTPAQMQYVAQISDITELMDQQQRLSELAYFDHLTGLPNRTYIAKKMLEQMAIARRSGRTLAVVYLDLDNFKIINDTYGHDAGDSLLRSVAHRMTNALREVDSVARIGGDEFVCILTGLTKPTDCLEVLGRLEKAIVEPIALKEISDMLVVTTSSMGVVFAQEGDLDPDPLLRRADMLMYEAKRNGGNQYLCEDYPLSKS